MSTLSTGAKIGLGANLPEDAIYPTLYADENGDVPLGDLLNRSQEDGTGRRVRPGCCREPTGA